MDNLKISRKTGFDESMGKLLKKLRRIIMNVKDQYKQFDPQKYIDHYFGPEAEDWEYHRKDLQHLHDIFKTGNINGKTLLDIGTGPCILSILSASRHFVEIYLTDYAESNITFLNSWWKGNSELQPEGMQFVLDKEANAETVSERTRYIKSKIKGIESIDITSEEGLKSTNLPNQFDIITSVGCLDAAASSLFEYEQCVKNIWSLLKDGGHVVMVGELGESFYDVGGTIYSCIKMYSSTIRKIFETNGFKITYWKEYTYASINDLETDSNGRMIMVAQK